MQADDVPLPSVGAPWWYKGHWPVSGSIPGHSPLTYSMFNGVL